MLGLLTRRDAFIEKYNELQDKISPHLPDGSVFPSLDTLNIVDVIWMLSYIFVSDERDEIEECIEKMMYEKSNVELDRKTEKVIIQECADFVMWWKGLAQ
jgi:hypothetical protein